MEYELNRIDIGLATENYILDMSSVKKSWDTLNNGVVDFISFATAMLIEAGFIVIAPAFAAFIVGNYLIIQNHDKGNGIWVGFYGPVPNLGWGSD